MPFTGVCGRLGLPKQVSGSSCVAPRCCSEFLCVFCEISKSCLPLSALLACWQREKVSLDAETYSGVSGALLQDDLVQAAEVFNLRLLEATLLIFDTILVVVHDCRHDD